VGSVRVGANTTKGTWAWKLIFDAEKLIAQPESTWASDQMKPSYQLSLRIEVVSSGTVPRGISAVAVKPTGGVVLRGAGIGLLYPPVFTGSPDPQTCNKEVGGIHEGDAMIPPIIVVLQKNAETLVAVSVW
jgi:hypothetical protein